MISPRSTTIAAGRSHTFTSKYQAHAFLRSADMRGSQSCRFIRIAIARASRLRRLMSRSDLFRTQPGALIRLGP
jgi:hypothetical protein